MFEFENLKVNDLYSVCKDVLSEGMIFKREFYFIKTADHKTVGNRGLKMICFPASYHVVILVYVVKILKPRDDDKAPLLDYLSSRTKFLLMSSQHATLIYWGSTPFSKIVVDFNNWS